MILSILRLGSALSGPASFTRFRSLDSAANAAVPIEFLYANHTKIMATFAVETTKDAAKTLVVARRCGRLANRLVLFSNVIAYVEEHGGKIQNPMLHSYAHHFQNLRNNLLCSYPARTSLLSHLPFALELIRRLRVMPNAAKYLSRVARYFGGTTVRDDDGLVDLQSDAFARTSNQSNLMFIDGWAIRAPSLVVKHADAIRDFFRPTQRHQDAADQTVNGLRETCSKVVGVHVRHGDYRGWLDGKYFFTVAQYQSWMRQVTKLFPNDTVGFIVCTDNRKDCELICNQSNICTLGPGEPVSDLFTLSQCDYIIGPHSTFSQWASFHGNVPLFHLNKSTDSIDDLNQFRVSNLEYLVP